MDNVMEFASRAEFRAWLAAECLTDAGVWLLFGKAGGPRTITANEALEEALCFGWIDGQMQSLDDKTYKNTFPGAVRTVSGRKRISLWQRRWSVRAS